MLAERSNSPRIQKVLRGLLREISSGRYSVGETLPPHSHWAKVFNVSTFTVHSVFSLLQEEGVVGSKKGSGTFLRFLPTEDWITEQFAQPKPTTQLVLWQAASQKFRKTRQTIARHQFQRQFQQQHSHVEIQESDPAGGSFDFDMNALVVDSILEKAAPTTGRTTQTFLPFLVGHESVTPLDGAASSYLEQIHPRYAQACCWKGKPYLLPTDMSYSFLWFDKSHFSKAGLDPAQPPRDWEEFADCLRKLSKANQGKPSFHLSRFTDAIWFLMNLAYQAEPGLNQEILRPFNWNSSATRQAVEFFHGIYVREKLVRIHTPGSLPLGTQSLAGQIPMSLGMGIAQMAAQLGEADRFGMAPMPIGPTGKVISLLNCGGWFVNARANSSQQQAAFDYIAAWEQWIHLGEGGDRMKQLGVYPSIWSLLRDPAKDRFIMRNLPRDWQSAMEQIEANSRWEAPDSDAKKVILAKALQDLAECEELMIPVAMQQYFRTCEYECGFSSNQ